eukprot:SAG22_NODE_664_length_8022_cov_2.639576_4_plen_185_part_00
MLPKTVPFLAVWLLARLSLQGRLLHGTVNSWADYGSALAMVAGIAIFSFSNAKGAAAGAGGGAAAVAAAAADVVTSGGLVGMLGAIGSGGVLLSLYLLFDSFQSQWQGGLFRKLKVDQMEMMRGCVDPPPPLLAPHIPRLQRPLGPDRLGTLPVYPPAQTPSRAFAVCRCGPALAESRPSTLAR